MLVSLTKCIYVASKGQDACLKLLSGTLKYYPSADRDCSFKFNVSGKGDESFLSVNLLYMVLHTLSVLKILLGIRYGYHNLNMFSR